MFHVTGEILISGLQNFEQYQKLNLIDIEINDSQIISSLSKYVNYRYHLKITSLLLSASFDQTTNAIFITCGGLNDTRKSTNKCKTYTISLAQ